MEWRSMQMEAPPGQQETVNRRMARQGRYQARMTYIACQAALNKLSGAIRANLLQILRRTRMTEWTPS